MIPSALLLLGLSISLQGGSSCPTPRLVAERLSSLLPREQDDRHVARLEGAGDEVTVELFGRDGERLGARRLHLAAGSCAARAKTIAVLLAAWELELRGSSPTLPAPVHLPTPPPAVTPAPPAPPAPPPPAPAEAKAAASPAPSALHREANAAPRRLALELGAGALGSIAAGQPAFGGMVTALFGPRDALWFLVTDLDGVGSHSVPYGGGGFARWNRFALGAGPGLRLRWRWAAFEAFAMASVSWLQLQGAGFSTDQTGNDVDLAVGAGVRIAVSIGKLHPWVGARVDDWLRGERVQVSGLAGPVSLPNVEIVPALGCDLDLL